MDKTLFGRSLDKEKGLSLFWIAEAEALSVKDALHPLSVCKPRYLLTLRHNETPHAIHVHPSSLGLPSWGGGHMLHLTPTCLMCVQNSTQDQTPTCKGICTLLPPYPQSRKLVVHPAQHICRCVWLVLPERAHTTFLKNLNQFPMFKNCDFFFLLLNQVQFPQGRDCPGSTATVLDGVCPVGFTLVPTAPCDLSL